PVRSVGNDDLATLLELAPICEVGTEEHQAGQLALAAGRGLERDGRQAGDFGKDRLEPPHELQRALRPFLLLKRVEVAEPSEERKPLVDARVVLHRARTERVEASVDPEVASRQLGEVADELGLGHLREPWRPGARQPSRNLGGRKIVLRKARGAATRLRTLVDQLRHDPTSAITSASRSISAGARPSLAAAGRPTPGPAHVPPRT